MPLRRRIQSKRVDLEVDEHIVFVRAADGALEVDEEDESPIWRLPLGVPGGLLLARAAKSR